MRETFEASLTYARRKDAEDPLAGFRSQFHFPRHHGKEAIYFCGNSLGIQPVGVSGAIQQELEDWRDLAVSGYSQARNPWLFYQHQFRESLSKIAGCQPNEVTVMNALTVNLHLLMLSFYRPTATRFKIIMEAGAFPSDQYAVETQVKLYGLDPREAIIEIKPPPGKDLLDTTAIVEAIESNQQSLALLLFGGINYYTGQFFDMAAITAATHRAGALAGFDLAHVIGNTPVSLHDWDVDFAVWCSYKYLNAGPGAAGGAFIHDRWLQNAGLFRLGGWWGNDEKTRFEMKKGFIPKPDASGWNLSTAQVFNMAALKASLELFDQTTMAALRRKSVAMTAYLEFLLGELTVNQPGIITPANPAERGAQLSLYFGEKGRAIHHRWLEAGIIVDYREPGVIRVAPAPFYNSFEDCFRFFEILQTES